MNNMDFETQLHSITSGMEYPPTPDIVGTVTARIRLSSRPRFFSRRLAWSLTIMLVLLSSLMLIPPARAAIIEFIQIGIVRIFPRDVEPTSQATSTALPDSIMQSTATPDESVQSLIPMLNDLAGETELAIAKQITSYPILLPAYPPELGLPDHVYVQDAEGPMTILVWVDAQQPERITMSLHFIPTGSWAINKMGPVVIQETEVNGQRAIWAEGPYPLILQNGDIQSTRMIDGHVLIWADGDVTYRLETDQDLEEAIKTAESLKPIN
jgi:hypothetical protein